MTPKKIEDKQELNMLQAAASMFAAFSPNNYIYKVRGTYFDYGQDWMWTTIICEDPSRDASWQVLSPRQWENILTAQNEAELVDVVREIKSDTYWLDK